MSNSLIQCLQLSKSFHSLPIFENISLSINEGDRFALIGENGSGKTTLLKLLIGCVEPDSGKISHTSDLTIGYLPQEVIIAAESVKSYFEDDRLLELEQHMSECLEDPERLDEWEQFHEAYVMLGGYRRAPVEKVLLGLKISDELINTPVPVLSSGQKMRVALAKVLIQNPDLLLLDEPTNHLDAGMTQWLKEMLLDRKGPTVIVSHDRKFLNEACNHLIEIKNAHLISYGGNYDFYLDETKRKLQRDIKAFELQKARKAELKQKIKAITFAKKKPRPPNDRNVMAYDRRGEHHQRSVQRNLDVLKAELDEVETNLMKNPKPKEIQGIRFSSNPIVDQVALELYQIEKKFGRHELFTKLSKMIYRNDRIMIEGRNGWGKTTLLKCIAGIEKIDKGKICLSSGVKMGYLDQEGECVPMALTPVQFFGRRYQLTEEGVRRELNMAALGGSEVLNKPFEELSVGQRKRLMILGLILEKPNVLLLDEPTNHLDLMTLEALEKALQAFKGAVIAVSHDATFVEKIGRDRWHFK